MNHEEKIYGSLGLAMRAGMIKSGEFSTEKSVKSCRAKLVIVTEDASENTKKLFTDKCKYYHIPVVIWGSKVGLAHAIGQEVRTSVAIEDRGFAEKIRSLVKQYGGKIIED